MKNLIQKTIEKIKKEKIKPEPKWKFLLIRKGFWFFTAVSGILAAVAFSVAFDNVSGLDWDLHSFAHKSRWGYAFSLIPFFWLILIVIFGSISFLGIRKSENGYRYAWSKIIPIFISGIFILGSVIFVFGFGGSLHSLLAKKSPYYSIHMATTQKSQWSQAEKGFLAGTIISVSQDEIKLEDFNEKKWRIEISENTLIRPSVSVSSGEMIKIIGEKKDERIFRAKEIRPWKGCGMMGRCRR